MADFVDHGDLAPERQFWTPPAVEQPDRIVMDWHAPPARVLPEYTVPPLNWQVPVEAPVTIPVATMTDPIRARAESRITVVKLRNIEVKRMRRRKHICDECGTRR